MKVGDIETKIPCWRREWAPGFFLPYCAPRGTHAKCLLSPSTKKYQVTGIVHFTTSIKWWGACLSYFQWELEGVFWGAGRIVKYPAERGKSAHRYAELEHTFTDPDWYTRLCLTGKFTRRDLRTTSLTLGCVVSCLWETNNNIYIWLVGRQSYDSAIILDRRKKKKNLPASN